jgi:hypothetical protein
MSGGGLTLAGGEDAISTVVAGMVRASTKLAVLPPGANIGGPPNGIRFGGGAAPFDCAERMRGGPLIDAAFDMTRTSDGASHFERLGSPRHALHLPCSHGDPAGFRPRSKNRERR